MQYKETLVQLLLLILPSVAFSQTTYLPQDARENMLLERLEIKAGTDSILNFSKLKPFSRKQYIPQIENYYRAGKLIANTGEGQHVSDSIQHFYDVGATMSKVDVYNAEMALMSSPEWSAYKFQSKKTFLKKFYKTPANFYEVNTKDFFLALNPVFQYVVGKEKDNSQHIFLNTRGITLRAMIANKIGLSIYATDNQERDPLYVQQLVGERQAVPGQGYYKEFKGTGYDYFDARGYFTFGVTKYIDVAFGYDKNFIGNGYRSLFLSDFSSNMLFLKVNTRIWKFNYQNLFMELTSAYQRGADQNLGKKYAAMHHLDLDITRGLNVGLFEGVVFGRRDHFEFGYLNPVIFYRSAEQQNGSPDNAVLGLDIKGNLLHHVQLYGQLLLDELKLDQLKQKWWGNKFGFQAGAKYIDAFGIPNFDLQAEWNRVRPFTYSHDDSVANYSNYNQPLAHPLGANFNELIGIVRYQPIPKLMLQAKGIYYKQGKDIGNVSYGSNILLPNVPPYRTFEYGFEVGSGAQSKIGYGSLLVSYEVKPNLFVEASGVYRKQNMVSTGITKSTSVIYAGIRWNMHRREFDY